MGLLLPPPPSFIFFIWLLLLNTSVATTHDDGTRTASADGKDNHKGCPSGCICTEETLECSGVDLETIPPWWPSHHLRLLLRNWTFSTIDKNAFRRFSNLRELHILDCPQLDLIDRHAFKRLTKLRSLVIRGNKSLRELHKASFSSIGNDGPLSIRILDNALERIRAFAFRNAQNLRELVVEERCFELEKCALGTISRLDFLTLHGVCSLDPFAFQNTTQLHQLLITGSALSQLPRNGFAELSYVSELQIRECRIGGVEEGALAGLFTVGSVQIQSNQITRLSPGWSRGMDNVGKLVFSYNTIRDPLLSPECLHHNAQRFEFNDNTLQCTCKLQWLINAPDEEQWLAENYCGAEEAFKALLYYSPAAAGCPPWVPVASATSPTAPPPPLPSTIAAPPEERFDGQWSDPEDEPFPADAAPHRRHSNERIGPFRSSSDHSDHHPGPFGVFVRLALLWSVMLPTIPIILLL